MKCRENWKKVKNGYGNSHNKAIQLIIDFTLKKISKTSYSN